MSQGALSLMEYFGDMEDPRVERTKRHKLFDMVAITICAVIGGADDWVAVANFGEAKREWFERFLELPNGIPSHDTFGRVFSRLDHHQFASRFADWANALAGELKLKAFGVDGKTSRGSGRSGRKALHLVSLWANEARLTLGLVATQEKSNEITAIPKLLEILDLHGAIVTIDAMGCQTGIAEQIVEQGGDYLLQVKGNQPNLHQDCQAIFDCFVEADFTGRAFDCAEQHDDKHGRQEHRVVWVFNELEAIRDLHLWRDLRSLVVVVRERHQGGKLSSELSYYISSRQASAAAFLDLTRGHWHIENSCHWVLDVCFAEDHHRASKGHAPANIAIIRRIALAILKRAQVDRLGAKNLRLKAGWDLTFLEQVLAAGTPQ